MLRVALSCISVFPLCQSLLSSNKFTRCGSFIGCNLPGSPFLDSQLRQTPALLFASLVTSSNAQMVHYRSSSNTSVPIWLQKAKEALCTYVVTEWLQRLKKPKELQRSLGNKSRWRGQGVRGQSWRGTSWRCYAVVKLQKWGVGSWRSKRQDQIQVNVWECQVQTRVLGWMAAVRADHTTDQAKLKFLRQKFSAFDALNPPGWSDGRLGGPSHHSVWCLPLYRFRLKKPPFSPSRHASLGFPGNDFNIHLYSFTLINL